MQHVDCVAANGEEDSVTTGQFAVEEFADYLGKSFVLRSYGAAFEKRGQGGNRTLDAGEPVGGSLWVSFCYKRHCRVHVGVSGCFDYQCVSLHTGSLCFFRNFAMATSKGIPRPSRMLSR